MINLSEADTVCLGSTVADRAQSIFTADLGCRQVAGVKFCPMDEETRSERFE